MILSYADDFNLTRYFYPAQILLGYLDTLILLRYFYLLKYFYLPMYFYLTQILLFCSDTFILPRYFHATWILPRYFHDTSDTSFLTRYHYSILILYLIHIFYPTQILLSYPDTFIVPTYFYLI